MGAQMKPRCLTRLWVVEQVLLQLQGARQEEAAPMSVEVSEEEPGLFPEQIQRLLD